MYDLLGHGQSVWADLQLAGSGEHAPASDLHEVLHHILSGRTVHQPAGHGVDAPVGVHHVAPGQTLIV